MAAMFEILAKVFVHALETYAGLGLIFAAVFVWIGVQRLDSEALGSGVGFRLLILPGVAAFWPIVPAAVDAWDCRPSCGTESSPEIE